MNDKRQIQIILEIEDNDVIEQATFNHCQKEFGYSMKSFKKYETRRSLK